MSNIVFTVDKYYLLQQYLTRGNPSFKFKSSIYKRNEPLYYMLTRSSSFDLTEENIKCLSEPAIKKVLNKSLKQQEFKTIYKKAKKNKDYMKKIWKKKRGYDIEIYG